MREHQQGSCTGDHTLIEDSGSQGSKTNTSNMLRRDMYVIIIGYFHFSIKTCIVGTH